MAKTNKEKPNKDEIKKEKTKKASKKSYSKSTLSWDKLDNTANLFPVIVSESVTNVYRISATLTEDVDPMLLQEALDLVLPYFQIFKSKLKKGIFWYYFEENLMPTPRVVLEDMIPCAYINPITNNGYLFRITYYGKRINLEAFHVLTDGSGAIQFIKELVYQYLRLKYSELKGDNVLHLGTSFDREDSYIKNYKKSAKKRYKTEKAVIIKGERFPSTQFGIIHGYINLPDIKARAKEYNVTINHYLIAVLFWAIYKEALNGLPSKFPISACVPVNLRPYFNSETTKNFFAVVSAVFKPEKDEYTFEEVLSIISTSLKEQITKEHLEKLFSYNVSSQKKLIIRAVPIFIKNIAMKMIYKTSARANTTTITNMGVIDILDEYKKYIDKFHIVLSMSKGQNIKESVCSYGDTLVFTFSSAIKETSIQKAFFRKLTEDGIGVKVESNGAYYE